VLKVCVLFNVQRSVPFRLMIATIASHLLSFLPGRLSFEAIFLITLGFGV